jgi:hypothetical protein
MEPELPKAYHRATLVDLLDRVLDKGLFLRADLVISLAGIPLIGATLSLAVAGTETMLKYGMLSDWDEAIRAVPPEERQLSRNGRPNGLLLDSHAGTAASA